MKRAEIANYEGVLQRNRHSRWYDQGRRHMVELENELKSLLTQENVEAP